MKKRCCYVLTQNDMKTLYALATSSRDKFIACLLYETGLRLPDCASLFPEDIVRDYTYRGYYIQLRNRGKLSNGGYLKTGERTISISPLLYRVYKDYLKDRETYIPNHSYLFINLRGKRAGHPMSLTSLQKLIQRWQAHTGLPITASIFRYTHGCVYYDTTQNIELVHQRLGHTNIETSLERYIHN